jgi:hypothetical protein
MWLTGRLAPDFKTIADFRRDNGKGIRNVCRRFVVLCRELKLFSEAVVAIDGSKFKTVNNRERNYTPGKIERRERELDESIQRYIDALETADRTQPTELAAKTERLEGKIQKMRQRMQDLQEIKAALETQPDRQISQTDPDARAMTTHSAKGTAFVGYNVQKAVDTKNHLIVAHEITNSGSDRSQLSQIALAAREAMGKHKFKAIADRGYYSGVELKACDDAGIAAIVPKPRHRTQEQQVASTDPTSSTSPAMMNTSVPQGNAPYTVTQVTRKECRCVPTGAALASDVPSRPNVRPALTDASGDGNMKR